MLPSRILGDDGEVLALSLLKAHGYDAEIFANRNNPTYDVKVLSPQQFLVSVKTSDMRQHVRLGNRSSVEKLTSGNFVFAFMPSSGSKQIEFRPNGYRLLIVPAEVASKDTLHLLQTYDEERGITSPPSSPLFVKGYSKRLRQREVWLRWAEFEDAWDLLPKT